MENTPTYETLIAGKAGGIPLNITEAQKEMSDNVEIMALTTEYSVIRIRNKEFGHTVTALYTRIPQACYLRLDESFIGAFGFKTHDEFYEVYPVLKGVEWIDIKKTPIVVKLSELWLQAMATEHESKQKSIT